MDRDRFNAYEWQGKKLHSSKAERKKFYDRFVFKDGFGFFEVGHRHLSDWIPHPSLQLWTRLNKVDKCKPQLSVYVSVVGIYPKSFSRAKASKQLTYQSIAKNKIKARYERVFDNKQDHKSSSQCVDDYATIAIFARTGPQKSMNHDTIFDQKSAHNNLTCVAAVTFIPNPSTHLNVLWLGVTNVPTFLNQSMVTWRRNGLGYYLMLVLIQQQVTSNTLPKVFLQCSRNEASFNFYTLIGFVPCLPDDEKKAGFTTLPSHAHMVEPDIMNLVLHEKMLRKAGLSRIDCSQSDTEVERSSPSSCSTLVYCRFPPLKGTSVADLEACCKCLPIITLLGLPCIQPQHSTFYKLMGYTAKGFVKGDTRIEFDVGSFKIQHH